MDDTVCFCGRPVYCSPRSRRPHRSGLCRNHYERNRRGLPLVPLPPEPPPPCEKCGEHHGRRQCEPIPTASTTPAVRIDRELKPEAGEIAARLGATPGEAIVMLMGAATRFREETGRCLQPADIHAAAQRAKGNGHPAEVLPPVRTRVVPQVRISPEAWEEAAEISRGMGLRYGLQAGRSATAGIRGILQAAAIFRKLRGRPLVPQDIAEQARRVSARRRKGAGNGNG